MLPSVNRTELNQQKWATQSWACEFCTIYPHTFTGWQGVTSKYTNIKYKTYRFFGTMRYLLHDDNIPLSLYIMYVSLCVLNFIISCRKMFNQQWPNHQIFLEILWPNFIPNNTFHMADAFELNVLLVYYVKICSTDVHKTLIFITNDK